MRVFISIDMEGVAGVANLDQVVRGGHGYSRAQELMTEEANAAVRGAFAGGAIDVAVADSHGTMDNLLLDRLDRRARVVSGAPRTFSMMEGMRPGDAMVAFVGYHAAAGQPGVLAHTFSSNFTEVRVDGQAVSEAEVNALAAASAGVPVGFLSGDDQICEVGRASFPSALLVEVKVATSWAAADSLNPLESCARIESAMAEAVAASPNLPAAPRLAGGLLEVDFASPLAADMASLVPGSVRAGGRTVGYRAPDVAELLRAIMAFYHLASLAAQQMATVAFRR